MKPPAVLSLWRRASVASRTKRQLTARIKTVELLVYLFLALLGGFILVLASNGVLPSESDAPGSSASINVAILIGVSGNLLAVAFIFLVHRAFGSSSDDKLERAFSDNLAQLEGILDKAAIKVFGADFRRNPERLYEKLVELLHLPLSTEGEKWQTIRVFAPSGVWLENEHKAQWLAALASYIKSPDEDRDFTELRAVFGLPPIHIKGDHGTRSKEAVDADLESVKKALEVLGSVDEAAVHYMLPLESSVGFGAVLFEDKLGRGIVSIAFACKTHADIVDVSFTLDNPAGFNSLRRWFDERIFQHETAAFVLKDKTKSFDVGWTSIKEWYDRTLASRSTQPYVEGPEVYAEMSKIIKDFKKELRAFVVGYPKSPDNWTRDIIAALKAHKDATFRTIIAVDRNNVPERVFQQINAKLDLYARAKVDEQVKVRVLEMEPLTGSDIFIIERQHVVIDVPINAAEEDEIFRASILAQQPGAAKMYVPWFELLYQDESLTLSLDEWVKKRIPRNAVSQ